MASRSAEATIKGYFYQFDNSILEILKLKNDSDSITVEGIEDIDINSSGDISAIQCKYYEGTDYNHSIISEPIRLMLNHFANYKKGLNPKIRYILRGHYKSGHNKLITPIDVDFLKTNFLTYKYKKIQYKHHEDLSLGDKDLEEFISQLEININASNYDSQFNELTELLKMQFNCEHFSAEHFFYNNCLKQIKNLSIKSSLNDRTVTKKNFILSINTRKVLFNEWYIVYKTKKEYLKSIAQNLKSTRALQASKAKIILIGNNILSADNSELPIENFIINLISKYYKMNSALRDAKPITLVFECSEIKLKSIKEYLIDNEILFNDGYEHIKFSPSIFNLKPVITKSKNGSKIINSSYSIRIISKTIFDTYFTNIDPPIAFLNFSKTDIINQFPTGQFFDFKYCENLKDINQILTK